jgi:hypothetical protein
MGTPMDFINKISDASMRQMREHKILASLILAQACLESSFGRSGLAKRSFNLFGVKAVKDQPFDIYPTKEFYKDRGWVTIEAKFRKYGSWDDSIKGHSEFLLKYRRYEKVIGVTDYKLACEIMGKTGYATDPDYGNKLLRIIERYDLSRFDKIILRGGASMSNNNTPNNTPNNKLPKFALDAGNNSFDALGKLTHSNGQPVLNNVEDWKRKLESGEIVNDLGWLIPTLLVRISNLDKRK